MLDFLNCRNQVLIARPAETCTASSQRLQPSVSGELQSQDEAPTKSQQVHDRAQNLRTPSRAHPRVRPVEVLLRAASRGETHAASVALAYFDEQHSIPCQPAFRQSSATHSCPRFAKSP